MTPNQLETKRVQIRLDASEQMLKWLAGTLWAFRKSAGEPLQSQMLNEMEESLVFARKHHELATIQGLDPAVSDMLTAEFSEAFDSLSSMAMRIVKEGGP